MKFRLLTTIIFIAVAVITFPDPLEPTSAATAMVAGRGNAVQWREFSDQKRGFSVLIPGEPRVSETSEQGTEVYFLSSQGEGLKCLVVTQRISNRLENQAGIDRVLRELKDELSRRFMLKAAGGTPIKLGDHQGIEVKVGNDKLNGLCRIYLVNHPTLSPFSYSLFTFSENPNPDGMKKFLDSFKALETQVSGELPGPPPPRNTAQVSGGVLQGNAIKKVQPRYPAEAKQGRVQGAVQIRILVSEEGEVIEAAAVSGSPELIAVSLDAARQWRFKRTELSGVPVRIQGVLTFNFTLQ